MTLIPAYDEAFMAQEKAGREAARQSVPKLSRGADAERDADGFEIPTEDQWKAWYRWVKTLMSPKHIGGIYTPAKVQINDETGKVVREPVRFYIVGTTKRYFIDRADQLERFQEAYARVCEMADAATEWDFDSIVAKIDADSHGPACTAQVYEQSWTSPAEWCGDSAEEGEGYEDDSDAVFACGRHDIGGLDPDDRW